MNIGHGSLPDVVHAHVLEIPTGSCTQFLCARLVDHSLCWTDVECTG